MRKKSAVTRIDIQGELSIFTAAELRQRLLDAFTRLTGYGAGEAMGKILWTLVESGAHDEVFHREMWEVLLAVSGLAIATLLIVTVLRALRFLPERLGDADLDPAQRAT